MRAPAVARPAAPWHNDVPIEAAEIALGSRSGTWRVIDVREYPSRAVIEPLADRVPPKPLIEQSDWIMRTLPAAGG
jgi:hypothetical protein